jgi:hypothetical protein
LDQSDQSSATHLDAIFNMSARFDSADDYLTYLQRRYAKPYFDGIIQDREFHRLTMDELRQAELDMPEGPVAGIALAIASSYRNVLKGLSPHRRQLVECSIAAGVMEHGECNAFIARSPEGKFAILFSSGLAMFMHKYIKLVCAMIAPNAVTYCNRKDTHNLTREDCQTYLDEMISYFATHLEPRGPFIKLAEREASKASWMLTMAETFILCHELGHFFNGDLDDVTRYSALPLGAVGGRYEENRDHEIEFRADSVGYEIYLAAIVAMGMKVQPEVALSPIMLMFDLLFKLSGGASSSHPHPHHRVVRIVRDHFSPELAKATDEALKDPRMLPEVFPLSTPNLS